MNTIVRVSSDMSVPEALLPEQYFERLAGSAREMPEKRLMAAVLLDALVHLQRDGSAAAKSGLARKAAVNCSIASVRRPCIKRTPPRLLCASGYAGRRRSASAKCHAASARALASPPETSARPRLLWATKLLRVTASA